MATLPLVQNDSPPYTPRAMAASILVADDEPASREALYDALTDQGYEVTAVESGTAALEALNSADFDLLVNQVSVDEQLASTINLDWIVGLGGLETCAEQKDKTT